MTEFHTQSQGAREPASAPAPAPTSASDVKRARKRELDRNAQQKKRKRDRELIQKLQSQLRVLQQPIGDKDIDQLFQEREKDQARIERHLQRTRQIQALLQADLDDFATANNTTIIPEGNNGSFEGSVARDLGASTPETVDLLRESLPSSERLFWADPGPLCPSQRHVALPTLNFSEIAEFGNDSSGFANAFEEALPTALDCDEFMDWPMRPTPSYNTNIRSQDMQCTTMDVNMWTKVNNLLYMARGVSRKEIRDADEIDAHILITAITKGWDQARKSVDLDHQWELIREIDEIKFSDFCSDVDRLAMCRMLRRVLKNQATGEGGVTNVLPDFMNPRSLLFPTTEYWSSAENVRPSQLQLAHPVIADYFVWPGFREHLVFNHRSYSTNHFAMLFAASFRFLWPFEFRDMYIRNIETQMYQFSPLFLERAENLRCYTVDTSFITEYPEFRGDVPIFNPPPSHLALSTDGDLVRSQRQNGVVRQRVSEEEESQRSHQSPE